MGFDRIQADKMLVAKLLVGAALIQVLHDFEFFRGEFVCPVRIKLRQIK